MLLMLIISIFTIFISHPLTLSIMLFIQTILTCLFTGNLTLNYWYSYILFIIMVGGMLIIFIYMINIAANEKFKSNMTLYLILLTMLPMYFLTKFYKIFNLSIFNQDTLMFKNFMNINFSMIKYFYMPLSMILTFAMIYLFIILILTVKISNFTKGPMRQMNYENT
uniref:NADH-ubiquinone oxidoreductase chain 6 n=1 Tax=Tenebrionoidea sp. 3 KM-2017 TaxID=2219481 RepID=A0A346RJB1_9CUCU|nr:NADH dehydrogenase subunit 6 [Tenebrionoidea sp. 3 KM-2017]